MPTKLIKSITRETQRTTDRSGRPLVVTLTPAETITFRSKGAKRTVSVSLGHVLNLAKVLEVIDINSEKEERYKQRKKLGQHAKKHKKIKLPYSQFYYDALNLPAKK